MKTNLVKPNFKYPVIKDEAYRFGSAQIIGTALRDNGDWRDYVPQSEDQRRNGVESSACYVEAQQHTIATIQEEQYDLPDQNYSARFNLIRSGGTENGGDPIEAAQSFRHDGLIDEILLPFSNDILSWDDFSSFKGGDEAVCKLAGQKNLKLWKYNYDIVFEKDEPVDEKYKKLRLALRFSPVPMSVHGWVQNDSGLYIKPFGVRDNHLVECVYLDEDNSPWIWDTYPPYLKKLEPLYNSEFGMRWTVKKLEARKCRLSNIFNFFHA